MGRAERKDLIAKLEAHRQSRVLCYLTSDRQNANASVQKDAMPVFFEHLRQFGGAGRIDVFVFTQGGDTLAGFGLARMVREFAAHVGTLVPEKCHSAGTLFALGANQIVMTRGATLSPIDPSIVGPLNPVIEVAPGARQIIPLSVESVAGFQSLVTEDWDMKGEEARGAAFRLLAERVHPIALGNVYRTRQQIARLAGTLLLEHRKDQERIDSIVATLTRELGSHDYLIARREARQLLGEQLASNDDVAEGLLWDLYQDFASDMELGVAYDPALLLHAAQVGAQGAPASLKVVQKLVCVESSVACDMFEKEVHLQQQPAQGVMPQMFPGAPNAFPPQGGLKQDVVRTGWKRYP